MNILKSQKEELMEKTAHNMNDLLNRYSKSLNHIGVKNLSVLPNETKDRLKSAHKLEDKVKLFEAIEASLSKQGLI
jgi:hypothetical protein